MTFLAPAFLWLLPLVLAPLILHLLNKRPPKLLTFSHVKWIQDAHRKRMPKKKLKEVLLLLMRMLMLLFLILFFSRPVIRQGKLIGGQDDNSTLIVLVDTSASMGTVEEGRSALQKAAANLKDMLREMPASVRMGLLSYSDRVEKEFAPTTDRSKVLSFLDDLSVVSRPTEIKPALDMAYVMLSRQSKTKKSILILTDNQESQWRNLLQGGATIEQFDPTVSVIVWQVGRDTANHGASNVLLQLTEEGTLKGGWNLNRTKQDRSAVPWTLKLNGNIVGQGSATADGALPLEAKLPKGGVYSGSLDLGPDAAAFDNTFYLAGRIPKGFRVLVVEGETGLAPSDSETYYLKLALESPRDPRLEQMRIVSAETFSPDMLSNFDVLVLANVGNLKSNEEAIKAWVENGGDVLLTAGSHWQSRFFNTRPVSSNAQTIKVPENPAVLGLTGTDFEWATVKIQKYIPVENADDVTPLLVLTNGDPLIVKKRVGRGSAMCFTSSVDRAWNNLPSKPVFSPLMRELLSRLADPVGENFLLQGVVDAPFELRLPMGIESVSVVGPDGTSTAARVDSQGKLRVPPVAKPGLYRVLTNRKDADLTFAVNINRLVDEGNFGRATEGQLESIFPKAYVQLISPETKSDSFVANALEGVDATPKLLFLLILFLIAETILGWPLMRKTTFACVLLLLSSFTIAAEGNRFVFTQLKYDGNWDPYPNAHEDLFEMITTMTNIPLVPSRRVIEISSPDLFAAPSLFVKGNAAFTLSAKEKSRLKQYIDRGGFVFFDDTLADAKGPFGESVRALMKELYPEQPLSKLSIDHAVFRSFFLLRNVAGRRISEKYLEGVTIGGQNGGEGRTAVMYSPNDLMGAWVKDNLGQYVYSCEPGGEAQRWEAFKLTLNVVYFTLTGTYKKDAIHQPFIERKLGS